MKKKQNNMQCLGKKISIDEFDKDDSIHTFSDSYENNKKDLLNKIKLKDNIKNTTRRKALIAAACVAILCIPASVFAANAVIEGLRVNKEQTNKYAVEYNFENDATQGNVNSELYHSNVKFQYGYLPDGYKEDQPPSNKFSFDGSWFSNQNISVLLNGVDDKSKFSFANVLETTDITIINYNASLLHLNATDIKDFSKILLVFYNDYGYTLQIYAQESVPDDELIKIAENLQLVACSKEEAISVSYKTSTVATVSAPTVSSTVTNNVDDSNFLNKGDSFKGINTTQYNSPDLTYTVQNVEVRDSIKDLDISGFGYDYENVKQNVDSDGNLVPFIQKIITKGDGQTSVDTIVGQTSSDLKLIYVTMKVKNTSDHLVDQVKITPQICCLLNNNGTLSLPASNKYSSKAGFGEGWSVYCSKSTMYNDNPNSTESKQLLIQRTSIQANEEFEYHVAYIVNAENMNNMVLFFNAKGRIVANDTQQTIIKLY
ncbi:hypothetical protein [[Clostridium] fimetarium]|uniref:DUF4367 domain-containing protein n=1 Tax=[Clostridium] fimetarium TaxID=99656 RepID=A0A1I0QYE9_9FIRM|nr:hypothetical protein [[Clostridium] fimetarium]SEW32895.1 hypothetical protein SAMN05421659_11035 [[Clostridium] fimetarium]